MREQGQRLANLFAKTYSQCISHETEHKAVVWIEGGLVRKTNELDDIEQDCQDRPAREPHTLRPIGQPLNGQQKQYAYSGCKQADA